MQSAVFFRDEVGTALMYRIAFGLFVSLLLLAGCQTPEEQRAAELSADNSRCASLGFAAGSTAMADCMETAAANRQADRDRELQRQAMQVQRDKDDAEQQARQRQIDDQAAQDRYERIQREMNKPLPTGFGMNSDDSNDQPPTASRIPGMSCTGSGDDAACDARGQMCADGAIRDDCADAPGGF